MLFNKEKLDFSYPTGNSNTYTDEVINQKYAKGDVRIITEQARYPLSTIPEMVHGKNYELNPEFQRRHRWSATKKSRLIESFIMNVPIPPIFLYEDKFSHYEVMDGLQRLTAINDFYNDNLILEGLEEWPELNGRKYSTLPELVKKGVDRRYLSSIILLQETAKSELEAQILKQLVFERINSGGEILEPQESRNAVYNGPLNQLCIKLARNEYFCKAWDIPAPELDEDGNEIITKDLLNNELFKKMGDVELVLRFFAYRQRDELHKGRLRDYLDLYLKYGNLYEESVLNKFEKLFEDTIELIYKIFGEQSFWLLRKRKDWSWYRRATTAVYDPMMYVFSQKLDKSEELLSKKQIFLSQIENFYKTHNESFEGRNTNPSILSERNRLFEEFVNSVLQS